VGTTILATPFILLIFGPAFEPAGPVLQVLVWSLALLFLNVVNSRVMVVADRQDMVARFLAATLVTNLTLNVLLIPRLGATGSAVARVVSTSLLFAMSYTFVRRRLLPLDRPRHLFQPILASVAMAAVLLASAFWPLVVRVGLGATVYIGGLLILGTFRREDWALMRQTIGRPPIAETLHATADPGPPTADSS
jgi:O-antigen/teichoic acid export membrane protein